MDAVHAIFESRRAIIHGIGLVHERIVRTYGYYFIIILVFFFPNASHDNVRAHNNTRGARRSTVETAFARAGEDDVRAVQCRITDATFLRAYCYRSRIFAVSCCFPSQKTYNVVR